MGTNDYSLYQLVQLADGELDPSASQFQFFNGGGGYFVFNGLVYGQGQSFWADADKLGQGYFVVTDPTGGYPDVEDNEGSLWATLTLSQGGGDYAPLFTSGADTVNFNNLTALQKHAIAIGADIYDGLGGNDVVTLPQVANYNENVGSGRTLGWNNNAAQPFSTDSRAGDTYTVSGGDGDYYINAGADRRSAAALRGANEPPVRQTEQNMGQQGKHSIDLSQFELSRNRNGDHWLKSRYR